MEKPTFLSGVPMGVPPPKYHTSARTVEEGEEEEEAIAYLLFLIFELYHTSQWIETT